MKKKLKLFVWTDFAPDYSGGLAVAIAEDETEARALVLKEHSYEPYNWGKLRVWPIKKAAFTVSGGA